MQVHYLNIRGGGATWKQATNGWTLTQQLNSMRARTNQ